jgi:hypothetical protein
MNNFGKIKTKILKKLTESYSSQNKSEIKTILKTIKENKDFTEMYLFYEEIEGKYFEDKDTAKLYVEELNSILKNKSKNISKFCNSLNEKLGNLEINENELYSTLDNLLEDDTLSNIDKKVIAKKKLVDHLTTKKEIKESEKETYTANENLLHAVLANNFNVLYTNNLSEGQKEELKNILSISNEELESKTIELKESIVSKVSTLLSESTDDDLKSKLNNVKDEVESMTMSKYNYYRLTQLKNGLD